MVSIQRAQPDESRAIARLHRATISWGLLSRLGEHTVVAFYEALTRSDDAFCLVARDGGRIVGFVSGILDWRRVRPQMVRRMWWPLLLAIPAILREARWRRLVETGRYTRRAPEGIHAEFLTIGVEDGAAARLWVGAALIRSGIAEFRARNVKKIRGVVWTRNLPAVHFFEAVGFKHVSDVEIHPGEVSRMLVVEL